MQFGDEAYSIILNTSCSPHKVPDSLKPLFEYINDPSKGVGDALVDHIDERVKKFNTHEWRRKHMYSSASMLQITLKTYHEMCHA